MSKEIHVGDIVLIIRNNRISQDTIESIIRITKLNEADIETHSYTYELKNNGTYGSSHIAHTITELALKQGVPKDMI